MLISLRISQSLWKWENIWTWHILSNGILPMSLLGVALMSTWIILSLSIRYNFAFKIEMVLFMVWWIAMYSSMLVLPYLCHWVFCSFVFFFPRFIGSPFLTLSWWSSSILDWCQWYWCELWEMTMQSMLGKMMIWKVWWWFHDFYL